MLVGSMDIIMAMDFIGDNEFNFLRTWPLDANLNGSARDSLSLLLLYNSGLVQIQIRR